jgi:hypothetical protein
MISAPDDLRRSNDHDRFTGLLMAEGQGMGIGLGRLVPGGNRGAALEALIGDRPARVAQGGRRGGVDHAIDP